MFSKKDRGTLAISASPENKTAAQLREQMKKLRETGDRMEERRDAANRRSKQAIEELREAEEAYIHGSIDVRVLGDKRVAAADALKAVEPEQKAFAEHDELLQRAEQFLRDAEAIERAEAAPRRSREHREWRKAMSIKMLEVMQLNDEGARIEAAIARECPQVLAETLHVRSLGELSALPGDPHGRKRPMRSMAYYWLASLFARHPEDCSPEIADLVAAEFDVNMGGAQFAGEIRA